VAVGVRRAPPRLVDRAADRCANVERAAAGAGSSP